MKQKNSLNTRHHTCVLWYAKAIARGRLRSYDTRAELFSVYLCGSSFIIIHMEIRSVPCCSHIFIRDLRIVFSFESNLESNRPYTTQAVTQPNGLQAYRTACYRPIICWRLALWTCVTNDWCTDYGTPNWVLVYFNSVIKRVKQCCCTLILLPKSTLNANLTTANRFFTNDGWQRGRFENFESDHQYESNLESDVRFEI